MVRRPYELDSPGELYGGSATPRIAIVGAGLGGVAQAVMLVQMGITSFTVFEKSDGPGGTWWDNRYPGSACDVPSMLYSYDFMLVRWRRTHAAQAEIQQYIEDVIDRFGFRSHMEFGIGVSEAVWHEDRQAYAVTTTDGRQHEFDVVVSAVGMLNVPNEISWPGADAFAGQVIHSSRWPPNLDLAGKRVAVVGAGASAAQIVPAIVGEVDELVSFQREPTWVMPKNDHELSPEEYDGLATRRQRRRARREILEAIDRGLTVGAEVDGQEAREARARGLAYLNEALAGRSDLIEALTPKHPLRCKRGIQSNAFLQALTEPHVKLVPRGVARMTEHGLVDTDGIEYAVDIVVLATGFQTTNYVSTMDVRGRGGRSLHARWGKDPSAFLGLTVPGFPNFFMLYGPNTHGTVVTYVLERQAEFTAKEIRRMLRRGATSVEVRPAATAAFDSVLQRGLEKVVAWGADYCHSYYHSETGRNVTQWPWSHDRYKWMARMLRVPSSRLGQRRPVSAAALGVPEESAVALP